MAYDIVAYESEKVAKGAFLDAYFGDGGFERETSAEIAGLAFATVTPWFSEPDFYELIESRLQNSVKKKSSMQETMLDNAHDIMDGNITDLFDVNPDNGNLVIRNIKTLPRSITAAIKQMDIVRTIVPGSRPVEFQECLRIVMHDKTKVMNIIGDYTDVKNTALKRSESGAPKMVGMSLITAPPKVKEIENGEESGNSGEVHNDPTSASEPRGDSRPEG